MSASRGVPWTFLVRVWRARQLTVLLLALYTVWAVHGFTSGSKDHREPERSVASSLQIHAKRGVRAVYHGHVLFGAFWTDYERAPFQGPGELEIVRRSNSPAIARFTVELVSARPQAQLRIRDARADRTEVLSDLRPWQLEVDYPILGGSTRLRFESDDPTLEYRVRAFSLLRPQIGARFKVEARWRPPVTVAGFEFARGSGWFKRARGNAASEEAADAAPLAGDELLYTRRNAYLRVVPPKPHAYWLAFPLLCHQPQGVSLDFRVDGKKPDGMKLTPYTEDAEMHRLSFGAHLGQAAIFEFRCTQQGRLESPRELGRNADWRRYAFGVGLLHLESVATQDRTR